MVLSIDFEIKIQSRVMNRKNVELCGDIVGGPIIFFRKEERSWIVFFLIIKVFFFNITKWE